jgi:hypothetical protein
LGEKVKYWYIHWVKSTYSDRAVQVGTVLLLGTYRVLVRTKYIPQSQFQMWPGRAVRLVVTVEMHYNVELPATAPSGEDAA